MNMYERLLDLIDVLYAAPGTDAGWQVFLDSACRAIGGSGASFISASSMSRAMVSVTARTDPAALQEYPTALERVRSVGCHLAASHTAGRGCRWRRVSRAGGV
jgi:hypothetical protein